MTGDRDLNDISTIWSELLDAHYGHASLVQAARQRVLERYERPMMAYLGRAMGCPQEAEDLYQTFVVKFLRGDFRNADPGHGRFRHLLKTVLRNLIRDYYRSRARAIATLGDLDADVESPEQDDKRFTELWCHELLDRTWAALELYDRQRRKQYSPVLRLKIENPALDSTALAASFSVKLGETSVLAFRKLLFRARRKFVELFVDEVRLTLESPSLEALEEELIALSMLERCQEELDRRRGR